ncbi:DEAD/DEAH box helicase [Catenulispora rubra]|uniref:DEAD/DEAH box helicase n=1 Tax=Catenulispora rubra TaxID=280293 RepID=UPI0018922B7F|nr:type ISP restriction/modification enzyme [Catenulispora rubra]
MGTSVQDVIRDIRAKATSNSERGSLFEQLMVGYLVTDALFADRFEKVWRWKDWPGNGGRPDTGIDLVGLEREGGGFCAIQCKFYEPDHTITKPDIDSFLAASSKVEFTSRLIISTTEKWNQNAEDAITEQQPPVNLIGLAELAASSIDWDAITITGDLQIDLADFHRHDRKQPREHQETAIATVLEGFADHDRGKLIMACGTGKTFTALKIAEELANRKVMGDDGDEPTRVLFLLPSISLLSQTLREWTDNTELNLHPFAVCSDAKATARAAKDDSQDIRAHDLALPSTTDPKVLVARTMKSKAGTGELSVIFSTYQSIDVISQAQAMGMPEFDLIVCDEAHRTTGVTLAGADESHFVKVHDNDFLAAAKRLYMTATPRIYTDSSKEQVSRSDAMLASMDDEKLFGPEFHRLGFGEAVERKLLTDYKVIVLAIDEQYVSAHFQAQFANDGELNLEDRCKIVGCWNALSKRSGRDAESGGGFAPDEPPMKRAVAFAANIAASKKIRDLFPDTVDQFRTGPNDGVRCEVHHVDGTMNALVRNKELNWLKEDSDEGNCRILTNARCLSEGVDVPSLDAVLFLNPRNSQVDVVQSVGRVMRKADGKDFGYIILPVAVPAGMPPEKALDDNRRFQVVWQVLQALRAHDDRFNAMINKIELNKQKPDNIMLIPVGDEDGLGDGPNLDPTQLALPFGEWDDALYAKIVKKVGERTYWQQWSKDVAKLAEEHVDRIAQALKDADKQERFEAFLTELRNTINPGVTEAQAIDMLAQHLITKPVFEALFAGYQFSEKNPVSVAMQSMLEALEDRTLGTEHQKLESFYDSVRRRAEGIDNHEGRQKVITELYEQFFKTALPKTADALGIVYTPVEVVDFILRATDQALGKYWGVGLTSEGVQVLDPFTGTGTFLVRLMESGLIKPEDLLRKYTWELNANEILLLAYYIAAINIEASFHHCYRMENVDVDQTYIPFNGIVLTDTFQMSESAQEALPIVLEGNHERAERQKKLDIRVIIGNPPYSVGQDSQNDNNQNLKYGALDAHIAVTYAAQSTATNKNSLYDSYIRAIRWATDRIKDEGIVCFVSNGGYIDGNTADGLRKTLVSEYDAIYCYNLRGNQRTAGELSRREGGKIFGSGSRSTVAILLLVKGGEAATIAEGGCRLFYRDIGDHLSREQKLAMLAGQDLGSVDWELIEPSPQGDWINHRDDRFDAFQEIGDKTAKQMGVFGLHSPGVQSNRDAWVYNFSKQQVEQNVEATVSFFNSQVDEYKAASSGSKLDADAFVDRDGARISWTSGLIADVGRGRRLEFDPSLIRQSVYRPFSKQYLYFGGGLNHRPGKTSRMFPEPGVANVGFYNVGNSSAVPFSVIMVDSVPDLHVTGAGSAGQFFPRYRFDEAEHDLFSAASDTPGYTRIDNITDATLKSYRNTYGSSASKDDIFYYVYALLHSPEYRETFAADLKKSLPRIPKVRDFQDFATAGRALADLHLNYESVQLYPLTETPSAPTSNPRAFYRVEKMKFGATGDRSKIHYNRNVTVSGIPAEAYDYQLGARSAIEWIIDRYQVKTDKASGIVNDPNDWSDDPRYIIDLLARIVTMSLETIKIVNALPTLDILDE